MSEELEKKERAARVYATLCRAIENREWVYDKKEEDLVVQFRVSGDDLPMYFTQFGLFDIANTVVESNTDSFVSKYQASSKRFERTLGQILKKLEKQS